MAGKGRQPTLLQCPIQRLHPLENSSDHGLDCSGSASADLEPASTAPTPLDEAQDSLGGAMDDAGTAQAPRRSRRAAALEARDRVMAQALAT